MIDTTLTNQALQAASVTGMFTLDALCNAINLPVGDKARRDAVWRVLAPVSDEQIGQSSAYCWQISPDARRAALRQFYALPQLKQFMKQTGLDASALKDDPFGLALSEILSVKRLSFDDPGTTADTSELRAAIRRAAAILDAAQFAAEVPALQGQTFDVRGTERETYKPMDLAQVVRFADAQIKDLQARSDIKIVMPNDHYGYSTQRDKISRFARGKGDEKPLLLTGIGGAGKSALLSRLMMGWRRSEPNLIQVLLDFDRRQLALGEPIEILQEMFRQITAFLRLHEDYDDALRQGLQDLRKDIALFKTDQQGNRASNSQQLSYALRIIAQLQSPWAKPLAATRIVLVLDTFEAIDRMAVFQKQFSDFDQESYKGNEVVSQIMEMLKTLQKNCLPKMRVVVSGREEPLSAEELDTWFGPRVRLKGLHFKSGAKLLQAEAGRLNPKTAAVFQDSEKAWQISRLLGGHPLALIAFAKYADNNPTDVDGLISELEKEGGFAAEFAQVFLYTRILKRITDPEVRPLAHPGLMLRFIDADIIHKVLAGPCLDRGADADNPFTQPEAEKLFTRLRNQYWLVDPVHGNADSVKHIPDLRRLMLPGLLAGPGKLDTGETREDKQELQRRALAVCQEAAEYFRTRGQGQDALDALYYGAFNSDPPEDFSKDLAEDLDRHLGEDIATMPVKWRGLIRHLLDLDLSEREVDALPKQHKQAAMDRAMSTVLQTGSRVFTKMQAQKQKQSKTKLDVKATKPRNKTSKTTLPNLQDVWSKRSLLEQSYAIQVAWSDAEEDVTDKSTWFLENCIKASQTEGAEEMLMQLDQSAQSDPFGSSLYLSVLLRMTDHAPWTPRFEFSVKFNGEYPKSLRSILRAAVKAEHLAVRKAGEDLLHYVSEFKHTNPIAANRLTGNWGVKYLSGWHENPKELLSPDATSLCLAAGDHALIDGMLDSDAKQLPDDPLPLAYQRMLAPLWEEYRQNNLTLSALERFYRLEGPISFNQNEFSRQPQDQQWHVMTMLRGLNPELHAPAIALLSGLEFHQGEDVVHRTFRDLALWPVDLQFDDQLIYSPTDASAIVQTADRCGALRLLLENLTEYEHFAGRLVDIYDLITRVNFDGIEKYFKRPAMKS